MSFDSQSALYDKLMRLPILLFTGYFLVREAGRLLDFLAYYHAQFSAQFLTELGARISLLLFLILLVGMHAIRAKPVNKASGWEPRISALLGLTLGNLLLLLDRPETSPGLATASALLLLAGNYLCIVTLLHLGRSISIMSEARKLVTSGPYSLIRHPLYFAEEVATVGIFLQFRSWEALAILAVHFIFQIRRMLNEERVLGATFPEYGIYMQQKSRLIPGVW